MEIYFELDLLKLNVTPLQALVLSLIDNLKEKNGVCLLSHKEVAEILNIARPNASRCIAALCKAGYLEKTDSGRGIKLIPMYQNDTESGIKMIPKRYQNDTKIQQKETKKEKERVCPLNPIPIEKEINKEKEVEFINYHRFRDENAHTHTHTRGEENNEVNAVIEVETETSVTPKAENKPNAVTRARALSTLDAVASVAAVAEHSNAHPALLEQFCMNNKITREEFATLANEIANEWQLKGTEHASTADARQHFFNLMRIKAREHRKHNPRQETAAEFTARINAELLQVNQFAADMQKIAGKSFMDD